MWENGITSRELAERAGVSSGYMVRLRQGRVEPTRKTMVFLAGGASDILGRRVHVAELFDLDVPMPK